jgi:hypothetical protein
MAVPDAAPGVAVGGKQGGGMIPEARKKDMRLRERFALPESESCIGGPRTQLAVYTVNCPQLDAVQCA